MGKATGGNQFDPWHRCGWPEGVRDGLLHFHVTAPGLSWRLDGILRNGRAVRASIGETVWLGQRAIERPIPGRPASIMVVPQTIFTGAHVQPLACELLRSATASGLIRVLTGPGELPALIARGDPTTQVGDGIGPRSTAAPWPSGLYVGVSGGSATGGSIRGEDVPARPDLDLGLEIPEIGFARDPVPVRGTNNEPAFLGGGQVGLNWRFDQFMLGVEASLQGGSLEQRLGIGNQLGPGERFDLRFGPKLALTGRAGVIWNGVLFYGKGGAAFAEAKLRTAARNDPVGFPNEFPFAFQESNLPAETNRTLTGWTLGAGFEAPVFTLPNGGAVTLGLEYNFVRFEKEPFRVAANADSLRTIDIGASRHEITARLNIPILLFGDGEPLRPMPPLGPAIAGGPVIAGGPDGAETQRPKQTQRRRLARGQPGVNCHGLSFACGERAVDETEARGILDRDYENRTAARKKAKLCDIVVYDGALLSHTAVVVAVDQNGAPTKVIGKGGASAAAGDVYLSAPGDQFGEPTDQWEVWGPKDQDASDVPQQIKDAQAQAQRTNSDADWLRLLRLCQERNRAGH